MTARTISARSRLSTRVDLAPLLIGLGVLAAAIAVAHLANEPSDLRLAVVSAAIVLTVGLASTSPRLLLFGLVVWLAVLGLLRRVLDTFTPTPHIDPLLLVGPAAIVLLAFIAAGRGAFRDRSRLATAVLALNGLTVLGAFNPLQGGISTGLAGLLFVLVPTLAFWVGRSLCSDRMIAMILKLFAILGIPAAVYGLVQTFSGFPSWDANWISRHSSDYLALKVNDVPRAFASFSSVSEYATFLGIAFVVWVGMGLPRLVSPLVLVALATLAVAILYEGVRGVVFLVVIGVALMAAARSRVPLRWGLAIAAALVVLLPFVVGHIVGSASRRTYSTPVVARQIIGLQNPTNSSASTLNAHLDLVRQGIHSAEAEPLGVGTGAVTIAGSKFGGVNAGTESDPGNAAVAFGFAGLIVYLVILVEAIRRSYRFALERRGWLTSAALAVVVVTALQWLNGGQYAVAFLPWLLLGWIDRGVMRGSEPDEDPEGEA